MKALKRQILKGDKKSKVGEALQECLSDLIDLALQGKQAHWNVLGPNFRSVHLQLDEIIAIAREGSDEVAERLATLGIASDGRAKTVAKSSRLEAGLADFQSVEDTVTYYADRMASAIFGLRKAIEVTGEADPITEDLLIGFCARLEKALWMLQAQEVMAQKATV